MFSTNENRNEGTFGCSPGTKTGTRAYTFACSPGTKTGTRVPSPKPPFYETALLSPSEIGFPTKGQETPFQTCLTTFRQLLANLGLFVAIFSSLICRGSGI